MADLSIGQKIGLLGYALQGGNTAGMKSNLKEQNLQMERLQQQMEDEERKRQQGMLQSGIQSLAMQPQRGPGQAVDVSALGPEGLELMKSRGMLSPAAGGAGYMEAPRPEIAQARSQMAMESAKTEEQTQKSIQSAQYTKAINEAARETTEHGRDLKLLEAHYAKGGSLQEFNAERKKLKFESDTLGRMDTLQAALMKAQKEGRVQSVSMGPTSIAFSLKDGAGGGTGDIFKDLSNNLEGFNSVRAGLVKTHVEARKLPQEQAKIRNELAVVGMKEFMSLASIPGPVVDGKQLPNAYVMEMLNTYAPHLDVDLKRLDLTDPNVIVGLADKVGQASATFLLGPKEAAAAEISRWSKAMAWMKGLGKETVKAAGGKEDNFGAFERETGIKLSPVTSEDILHKPWFGSGKPSREEMESGFYQDLDRALGRKR